MSRPSKIPSLWRPLRQGAIAAGSATWGAVALHFGIRSALLLAGSGTLIMTGLGMFLRLPEETVDLTSWNHCRRYLHVPNVIAVLIEADQPVLTNLKRSAKTRGRNCGGGTAALDVLGVEIRKVCVM